MFITIFTKLSYKLKFTFVIIKKQVTIKLILSSAKKKK